MNSQILLVLKLNEFYYFDFCVMSFAPKGAQQMHSEGMNGKRAIRLSRTVRV